MFNCIVMVWSDFTIKSQTFVSSVPTTLVIPNYT